EERRRALARGNDERSLPDAVSVGSQALGSRRALLSWALDLFPGLRWARRPAPFVGLDRQSAVGHVFALGRRFWQDLDQPAGGQPQVSAGIGPLPQEYLEDRAGSAGRAGHALLRRGAGRPFRIPRYRRIVVARARSL